jgi:hypothetical protein
MTTVQDVDFRTLFRLGLYKAWAQNHCCAAIASDCFDQMPYSATDIQNSPSTVNGSGLACDSDPVMFENSNWHWAVLCRSISAWLGCRDIF